QGRSRSGAMAVAYLMASQKVHVAAALCLVQAERATVQPNPGFLRQLGEMQTAIHALQLEDM
ncbi:MAG: dual specificity protein phosphatase family protein, partial [Promethearchaeia archaeon]